MVSTVARIIIILTCGNHTNIHNVIINPPSISIDSLFQTDGDVDTMARLTEVISHFGCSDPHRSQHTKDYNSPPVPSSKL